ncbi:SMI1/KNR4 family protein [Sutcliffiella cohnii]|uniref:SMI1/KNR4 family protein n=1 Tax=Sutcliffiella cohnii TaxID=33932 RepID=UPI002E1BA90F|nr:SMI1/KNR4 family protein [Sutcliffiella cohnii]
MSTIWYRDEESHLPPFTEQTVEAVEKKLHVKLPKSYIELMKQKNGFYLEKNCHPSPKPTAWGNRVIELDSLIGIGLGENSIGDTDYFLQEWGLRRDVVIISMNPPSFVCLDYRNTKSNPPIVYIDVDENDDFQIAANFEQFLQGLHVRSDEDEILPATTNELSTSKSIQTYKTTIDNVIEEGTADEVDSLFLDVAEHGDDETIQYFVRKIKSYRDARVRYNMTVILYYIVTGERQKLQNDIKFVEEILTELTGDKNKNIKKLAQQAILAVQKKRK